MYAPRISRRRLKRKTRKAQRQTPPAVRAAEPTNVDVRDATRVERLAYTRTQAAEALGISRSTFNRRVMPFVELVEMPWGALLIPVDELQRLLAERRKLARSATAAQRETWTPRRRRGRCRRPNPRRARRRQQPRSDRARAHRRGSTDSPRWRAMVAVNRRRSPSSIHY